MSAAVQLVVPGPLDQRTGGYIYDRRIADGLIPEGRWGQPDDVGRTVAALLRGDVPYATGAVIHVDGGLSVPRL